MKPGDSVLPHDASAPKPNKDRAEFVFHDHVIMFVSHHSRGFQTSGALPPPQEVLLFGAGGVGQIAFCLP